jgi:hypothetical protein
MSDNEELLAYIAAALGKNREKEKAPKLKKPRAAAPAVENIHGVSIVDDSAPAPSRRAPKPVAAHKPRAKVVDESPEPIPASVRRAPEPAAKRAPTKPAPHRCNCVYCDLKTN